MPPYFSLLVPSRKRAERAREFFSSLLATAMDPENIQILWGLDFDDPESIRAIDRFAHYEITRAILVGKWPDLGAKYRSLEDLASGEVLVYCADDFRFVTRGWDVRLREAYFRQKDGLTIATMDDCLNGMSGLRKNGVPGIFGLSRAWHAIAGYWLPRGFLYYCMDTWVWDVWRMVDEKHPGRRIFLSDVVAAHLHKRGGSDDTYERAAPHLQKEIESYVARTSEREELAKRICDEIARAEAM